jgi:hypothetical protein
MIKALALINQLLARRRLRATDPANVRRGPPTTLPNLAARTLSRAGAPARTGRPVQIKVPPSALFHPATTAIPQRLAAFVAALVCRERVSCQLRVVARFSRQIKPLHSDRRPRIPFDNATSRASLEPTISRRRSSLRSDSPGPISPLNFRLLRPPRCI